MPSPRPDLSRRNVLAGLAGLAIVGVSTAGAIVFNRDDTPVAAAATVPAASSGPASSGSASVVASHSVAPSSVSSSSVHVSKPSKSTDSVSAAAKSSAATSTAKTSTSKTSSSAPKTSTQASTYKDGQYTETGNYDSPSGSESVTVSVTLAADVITATSTTGSATSGPSAQYQEQFISGYASDVVGKDIDSVNLSRVSGSSLTSAGFNAALTKIKSDAKA